MLDPAADLPPEWGFASGDLPPIGASPDGMLRHVGEACCMSLLTVMKSVSRLHLLPDDSEYT